MSAARGWRVASWLCVPIGAAVFARTLLAPFWQDDRVQRAMALGGFPARRGVFDLYDFVRPGERDPFVQLGVLPWWTGDDFSMRFFRPIASALLFAEHRWLGSALAMHVLSLAWWAAAVLAAWGFFRRVVPERAAAIATLIFAIAPCHEPALSMLAQREVLIVLAFGIGALGLVLPGGEPSRLRSIGAGFLFAMALGAGEYGLCLGGYVLAHVLWSSEPTPPRLRRALPFAVPAAIYLVTRAMLGYGATGAGFYRDPLHDPRAFLLHAPRALSTLVVDAWSTLDAERLPLWALLAIFAVLAAVLLRATPAGSLRWLVGGSFLALIPLTASAPSQRLIGPALVGIAPALGTLLDGAMETPRRALVTVAAIAAAALHLIHAPIASFEAAGASLRYARRLEQRAAFLGEQASPGVSAGIVGLASWETAFFTSIQAEPITYERMRWHVLVTAHHALMLRTGDRTIDVVVPKGQGFFPVGADDIFRSEDSPFHSGDQRDVPGMHVLIVSDGTTDAPRMRFTFDRAAEDPTLLWCTEHRSGLEVIAPPQRGFGVQLSP